ncbi:DNA-processing protein DprA [Eubacteriales bacterium OttesenSCG-928-K08]|nr:DNA-processing protein DprA [Eubacteriales bacterium OttesenSCG-928-K08]
MGELSRKDQLWLWLYYAAAGQILQLEKLTAKYPDVEELFAMAKARDKTALSGWDSGIAKRMAETANESFIDEKQEWLLKNHVSVLPIYSTEYPSLLREIHHPPQLLFVKGRLNPKPEIPIAIVGMRRPTAYGEGVARHFGKELTQKGASIISGMAAGIDTCAALGALEVEGALCPTVAVLGCGVDVIYPNSNVRLYNEIIERGAVVSEFLPGTRPYRENFPMRNRVMSGMSRGVLVVEAAERSGTSITVNYALDQGRDVFAIPGRITDGSSVGPNRLIQKGEAKPVFCAADILFEYGVEELQPQVRVVEIDTSTLTQLEKKIVEELLLGEKSADELCEILSLPAAQVNSGLTSLQFSGIIKQLPGRFFSL